MNALTPAAPTSLEPRSLDEAVRFSTLLAKSTMVPRDFQNKPENILVAVTWGREIGLGTLQALQSIAVINGRPSVWGDAMLALVRGSGLCVYMHETIEGDGEAMKAICRTRRAGEEKDIIGEFSVTDAKKAGLWGKVGPWQQYPKRMLQLRARGFAVRDAYPDVLRGVISAEEARDIPPEPAFNGTTIEAEPSPQVAATPRPAARRPDPDVYDAPADPLDGELGWEWLRALKLALRDATSRAEVVRIGGHPKVGEAIVSAPEEKKREISDLLADAYGRFDGLDTGEAPEADAAA